MLTPGETELRAPTTDSFFANATGKGYYRTAYPADVYRNIVEHMESGLKPEDRISLIGDEWAQVRSGKATVDDYMNLVSAVKADKSAAVVSEALGGVEPIYSRVASTRAERDGMAAWLRATLSPEYERLGPPAVSDSPNTRELRASLFELLGNYAKDPAVITQAKEIAAKSEDVLEIS